MGKQAGDRLVAVDLFSGAGGLTEGLLAAGIDVPLAIERHPHPALTHAFNHAGTTVLCADIRLVDGESIKTRVKERTGRRHIDLVVGGPPCQGFSSAGRRDVTDPRNSLVHEFVRIVAQLKPKMFLFENVAGLLKMQEGQPLRRLLTAMQNLGYRFTDEIENYRRTGADFPLIDALSFGAPQRRRRLVIVGWKGRLPNSFKWMSPTHAHERVGETKSLKLAATVGDAISDLAFLTSGRECHAYNEAAQTTFQSDRRANTSVLFNHLATKHRENTVRMFRKISAGKTIGSLADADKSGKQRMRRLEFGEPCWTVLALPDDYIHYSRHRILTVREMARLQTFDDDYVFFGKRTTSDLSRRIDVPQYTQVGNAVPPFLAAVAGRAIVDAFGAEVRDVRNLEERRERHKFVRESSAFEGYSLSSDANDAIDVQLADGKKMQFDFCGTDEAENTITRSSRMTQWSKAA